MYKFKFADIGEGLHEGKVGEIFKNVGDIVKEGEDLFLVETDKVSTNIPSPVSGKITWIGFTVGQIIRVGEEIYHFETYGLTKESKIDSGASVVGEVKVSNEMMNLTLFTKNENKYPKIVLSTPLARSLATKRGIDISKINGSGYNNRVLVKDIENFNLTLTSTKNNFEKSDKRIKVTSIRKTIAKAMVNSWNNVAYTNLTIEVNMSVLWNQRKKLIEENYVKKYGTKITFLPFIMKAVTLSLKNYPTLNGFYDSKNDELVQQGSVHLGIAVDTPFGLFVPVIKNVEKKSIFAMNIEVQELAKKARENKLKVEEIIGSTFTISNYGSTGVLFGTPIINFPNIGILGVGAIVDRVFADNDRNFYNGKVMYITVAADHQWVDGAEIGNFALKIKECLENPALMEDYNV